MAEDRARFSLLPLGANLPETRVGEDELQAAFRTSASSIVELLRAGQRARQRAYQAGVCAALDDIQTFLTSGLDQHQPSAGLESLMNYIEARQAALRAVESDDSEEEAPQAGPSRPRSALAADADRGPPAAEPPNTPGPRTRSQVVPSSPASTSDLPATIFTFDCPPPRSGGPSRRGAKSARAVVLEAAASVAGAKRGYSAMDDFKMEEEPSQRPQKRIARRPA